MRFLLVRVPLLRICFGLAPCSAQFHNRLAPGPDICMHAECFSLFGVLLYSAVVAVAAATAAAAAAAAAAVRHRTSAARGILHANSNTTCG